jgi:hypothetical protein
MKCNEFEGLRIHGLLTDLTRFNFYSYDPVARKFQVDTKIVVDARRETHLSDMIDGTGLFYAS